MGCPQGKRSLPLDKTRNLNTIICDPQATVSGMCGTGIIIQGRIVHGSILCKKALSGTEMIPKQYNTPLRHRKMVGLHMEKRPLLGIYLTSGTILNPNLPSGNRHVSYEQSEKIKCRQECLHSLSTIFYFSFGDSRARGNAKHFRV